MMPSGLTHNTQSLEGYRASTNKVIVGPRSISLQYCLDYITAVLNYITPMHGYILYVHVLVMYIHVYQLVNWVNVNGFLMNNTKFMPTIPLCCKTYQLWIVNKWHLVLLKTLCIEGTFIYIYSNSSII